MTSPLVIIGASGHAKVIVAAAEAAGFHIEALYDDNPALWETKLLGHDIEPSPAALPKDTPAVIAIGANATRKRLADKLGLDWQTVVHPRAWVHESVELGEGTVVFAGAVIQPDTVVGRHVIVNTGATIDHDCRIGDFVHLAPGSHLAGGVTLGEGSFLGVSAGVIPNRSVGEWTTVGAGGIVVRDLPAGITATGVPARAREAK